MLSNRSYKSSMSFVLDRAVDADFLGLTQEEYIILTKEVFWRKRYFDLTRQKEYTEDKYCQYIGVKHTYRVVRLRDRS